jgi:hypothetical protein
MKELFNTVCPRCEKRGLKSWAELNDEQREMVKRLPATANFELSERQATHRWCTRCWYETTGTSQHA